MSDTATPPSSAGHPTSGSPIVRPARGVERIAALATGAALAGAAVLVAANDPSAPGSRFPGCVFHAATGLWCPGCGLTRGTHHLLTGDPLAALSSNVFTPFVVAAIALSWLAWALRSFGREVRLLRPAPSGAVGGAAIALVVVFGVVRNLPVAPFDALAP